MTAPRKYPLTVIDPSYHLSTRRPRQASTALLHKDPQKAGPTDNCHVHVYLVAQLQCNSIEHSSAILSLCTEHHEVDIGYSLLGQWAREVRNST
jgi:hypothetical protein